MHKYVLCTANMSCIMLLKHYMHSGSLLGSDRVTGRVVPVVPGYDLVELAGGVCRQQDM